MIKNKYLSLCLLLPSLSLSLSAQSHSSTQAHQEEVSSIIFSRTDGDKDEYYSFGKDGFIVKWTEDNEGDHYQVSELEIKLACVNPVANEIAIYETDGGAINRVSVWNWDTLTRKYARRFNDSLTSMAYSEKGTFLILGTATVDGAIFLRSLNGALVDKISDNTGIVSLINTSSTERTAVMYSPVGNLSYYNLTTGKVKARVHCEQTLEHTVMFNGNMFLSGIKNSEIFIVQAITGETAKTIKADNPIILSSSKDTDLYYLTHDGKGSYGLYVAKNIDNKTVGEPTLLKRFKALRSYQAIILGAKQNDTIILGARNGAIYKTDTESRPDEFVLNAITDNIYDKILDVNPIGEDFYFLTKTALYKSSYDSAVITRLGDNPNQTQLITYGDKLILWSKGTRNPVQLYDYTKPELIDLFTPRSTLQSVRLFGNKILEMESNSVVNVYDFDNPRLKEVYSGAGLQDAVICDDGKLYVSKSFATNPKAAMLCIDMVTRETVPLNINSNVTFALSISDNDIYGISVQSDDTSKSTGVFKYNTLTKAYNVILRLKDEDSSAFTYLHAPLLYTNIGKNNVRACNLSQNKNMEMRRSASMPIKVCQNANRVVVLNSNGSISWYDANQSQVVADWYLTNDGQWYEF